MAPAKTQWIAVSIYVLVATSLYQIILNVTLFEKVPILQALRRFSQKYRVLTGQQ